MSSIRAYFGGSQAPMIEDIDGSIVDVLIADMLFDPNTEESTFENALIPYELQKAKNIFEEDTPLNDWYKVTLKDPFQFHCSIDYLAIGCSFRQSAGIYNATKDRTVMASMGSLHQGTVAKYTRI